MPRRESYSDSFSGKADENIRSILYGHDEESDSPRRKLRIILLNVINNELTARQKQIIMLYYFKEYDTTEIAKELGVTPQSVSTTMARARMRMFRVLQYYI